MDDNILEPEQANQTSPPRVGGRNVFQIVWQRRGLVFFGVVLGITIGLLTYSQRPAVYRTSAQVLVVKKQDANVLQTQGADPRVTVMDDYVATHLIVIRSPTVIAMAVKQWDLGSLRSLQGREPVSTIQANLSATREGSKDGNGPGNNVLNLTYSGTDPADVEKVLRSIIASYMDFLDEAYRRTSNKLYDAVRTTQTNLTKELRDKNEEYKQFLKKSPVLILAENGAPLYRSKILEYQKEEIEIHKQLQSIDTRIKAVQKAIEEKQPRESILALGEKRYEKGLLNQNREQKENAQALEKELLPLYTKEADLKDFYGKDHPEVLRIQQAIKMTKESRQKIADIARESEMRTPSSDPVQNMLQILKDEKQQIEIQHGLTKKLLDEEKKTAREQEGWYNDDQNHRKEIARTEALLASTNNQHDHFNMIRGFGGFDPKTLAEPGFGAKISPVLWQFILMGAALGFLMTAGSAYLLDLADKSFRNPEEIRRRLGLPIVGHVPYVLSSPEPVMTLDRAGNPVELDPGLIALHQPMCPAAEGFRGIRTALYFNTHGQRHTVIQVTSPNMGDGKTTLITNLAVSIAQSGRKVLIVDADLRRPRVHRSFGLTGKVGLAEVISGTVELDEAIQVTVVPNLSVLPCGRRPQNPAELLTSPQFEDVIDDLRSAFDYVLIDTPPLLAVSDPCIVASRVDGLLLTIRLSKNGRPAAERARDLLFGLKVNCLGVVINGVGKHGSMTGYGYEHYRYADEYTTAYTTTTDDANPELCHDDPNASDPSNSTALAVSPTLVVEPSANGHSTHPLAGE